MEQIFNDEVLHHGYHDTSASITTIYFRIYCNTICRSLDQHIASLNIPLEWLAIYNVHTIRHFKFCCKEYLHNTSPNQTTQYIC